MLTIQGSGLSITLVFHLVFLQWPYKPQYALFQCSTSNSSSWRILNLRYSSKEPKQNRKKTNPSGPARWTGDEVLSGIWSLYVTSLGKTEGRRRRGQQDEMVGWHHQLDGYEFEQTLGVGDGQGSLVCCSPWGCKESDTTEWLNWLSWCYMAECSSIFPEGHILNMETGWEHSNREGLGAEGAPPVCYPTL